MRFRLIYEAFVESEDLDEALFIEEKKVSMENLELIFIGEEKVNINL